MIHIPIIFGIGPGGRVWTYRSSFVPRFFHVFFVPILALDTTLVEETEPGALKETLLTGALARNVSRAAGYFRVWPVVLAAVLPFTGLSMVVSLDSMLLALGVVWAVLGWLPGLLVPRGHRALVDRVTGAEEQ